METKNEYRVPETNLETLKARLEKLARRARRLRCEPPTLTVGRFEDVEYSEPNEPFEPIKKIRRYFFCSVTGAAPKLNGWTFAAVLQPVVDENGATMGNLLRQVPGCGIEIPERFRNAGNNCDHCKTIRRRNETYVLVNEVGTWMQVGNSCLVDFLGHQSPDAYASMAEILCEASDLCGMAEDDDGEMRGGRYAERFDAEGVLALTTAAVRLYGWTSRKTAREFGRSQATADVICEWLFAKSDERAKWKSPLTVTDEDKKFAAEVTEWMASLTERQGLSDYLYNLSLLGKGATFTTKNFGLACSAIPTYAKEKEFEIRRKKQFESDSNSQYVGAEGVRQIFENLSIVYTTTFEREQQFYGSPSVVHFYKFKDAAGNVIVNFSSNDQGWKQGDTVTVKATVKKHEEREGIKQTKLSRIEEYSAADEAAKKLAQKNAAWLKKNPVAYA